MSQSVPTIAVVCRSAALTSILAAALRRPGWRVREFPDSESVLAYMRLAPVALLVCDYALADGTAADLTERVRHDADLSDQDPEVVVLSRTFDNSMRKRCVAAGVNEVMAKPMSPLYLEERISERLQHFGRNRISVPGGYRGPERRDRMRMRDPRTHGVERRGDNVIAFPVTCAQHGADPVHS